MVATRPSLLGANERPPCQSKVERKGSRNAVKHLDWLMLEIGGLPAEPFSKIPCGDRGMPFIVLLDQKACLCFADLDAIRRQLRLPGENQVVLPHPDPHPDSSVEAHRRLPGPARIEPDTPGIV